VADIGLQPVHSQDHPPRLGPQARQAAVVGQGDGQQFVLVVLALNRATYSGHGVS